MGFLVRLTAVALTAGVTLLFPGHSFAVLPPNPVLGEWKLTKVLDSVEISSMDDEAAAKLIGQIMEISRTGARFGNYKCHKPEFETKRVEPNIFLRDEGGIDNSKLRLPNPVTVVDVSCATVFLMSRNQAVIAWRGYFFEASRVKRQ